MIDINKLAEAMILFTHLPNITVEEREDNFVVCGEDEGYIPHLYHFEGKYGIDWIGSEGDTLHYINGDTPEDAIIKAYTWCKDNKLINN